MNSSQRRLLIIKACRDVCAAELDQLRAIAGMFDVQHCTLDLTTNDAKTSGACSTGAFDLVYLAAHANTSQFGEHDGSRSYPWEYLATLMCRDVSLNPEAILFLGCCRGGLVKVALQLFHNCRKIDYVCGPRWTVSGADIAVGFHVFIYNMLVRREQPSIAVERATKATNYDFFCHDRIELERDLEQYAESLFRNVTDVECSPCVDGGTVWESAAFGCDDLL